MKATSLEQISTDYGIVMEHKEVALATLQRKEQVHLHVFLFLKPD